MRLYLMQQKERPIQCIPCILALSRSKLAAARSSIARSAGAGSAEILPPTTALILAREA